MRVLMVLIALVATPFIAGVSQDRAQAPRKSKDSHAVRQDGDRSEAGRGKKCKKEKNEQQGQHEGDNDDAQHCGSVALAEIHGTSFLDQNFDGIRDPSEPGVADWPIMLAGPTNLTLMTDVSGNYAFTGLAAGTYTVCEAQRYGWFQTLPQGGTSCAAGSGYTIVVTSGQVVTATDFGNYN